MWKKFDFKVIHTPFNKIKFINPKCTIETFTVGYLQPCEYDKMHIVGQTKRPFKVRIEKHRNSI